MEVMTISKSVVLTNRPHGIDCVYVAACSRDVRLTRICVASIRYFYPDIPIRLLAGDKLQHGLADELLKYWNVQLMDLPEGVYGWGFVKLEPLFGPAGQRFLVLDADTVFTGRVLDICKRNDAPFIVDDEKLSDADCKRLYYDWDRLRDIDPNVQSARAAFNVGQWFGTAGAIKRDDLDRWVEWTLPRRLRYPGYFMGGDQGVLNFVLLKKEALDGLHIERRTIMRWPGNSLDGLDVEAVSQRRAPPLVIHWAGMKRMLLRDMVGAELLGFFERIYFERLPMGRIRRVLASQYSIWVQIRHFAEVRIKLAYSKWIGGHLLGRTRVSS